MGDDFLDHLPLPVLLALQEALCDPTEVGRERARNRAEDAGFYIHCVGAPENDRPPDVLTTPIPMEEARAEHGGEELAFDQSSSSSSS